MSAPYIPHLTKPSGKDTVFSDAFRHAQFEPAGRVRDVPTDAERAGGLFRRRLAGDLRPHDGSAIHSNGNMPT
jgi:hypothetical protein